MNPVKTGCINYNTSAFERETLPEHGIPFSITINQDSMLQILSNHPQICSFSMKVKQ
jgi:hypothetical protein